MLLAAARKALAVATGPSGTDPVVPTTPPTLANSEAVTFALIEGLRDTLLRTPRVHRAARRRDTEPVVGDRNLLAGVLVQNKES